MAEAEHHQRAHPTLDPRRWWALALLCGAFFMVIVDGAIVIVALPSIDADLGFSASGLQWVISAYALTLGGLLLLGGRAADLLGRRRVFMAGVGSFTLASLMCGLAWSPAALIAPRAVQGVGAAVMTATALAIIVTLFERDRSAQGPRALGRDRELRSPRVGRGRRGAAAARGALLGTAARPN
jgi:MFS family permease